MKAFLEGREHGLTNTIFTSEPEKFSSDYSASSRVCFNTDPTLQSPHSPWGASGASGESPCTTFMEKFTRFVIQVDEEKGGGEQFRAVITEKPGSVHIEKFFESGDYTGLKVENIWSGVCGTDKSILSGDIEAAFPLVQGHENIAKTISGSTKDVYDERIETGDYVLWTAVVPCGRCRECKQGNINMCSTRNFNGVNKTCELPPHSFGGWSEKSFVNSRTLMIKLDEEQAENPVYTLVEPLATVINLEMDIRTGKSLIIGGGALGSLFAAVLSEKEGIETTIQASKSKSGTLNDLLPRLKSGVSGQGATLRF